LGYYFSYSHTVVQHTVVQQPPTNSDFIYAAKY
jgi:hypothetical protein